MPPTPTPPPPSTLHTLLSSLRSPIFHTAHNPTSARTGLKYLKRQLRGPAMVAYYPKFPSLATLNAQVPWNKFANWQGLDTKSIAAKKASGELVGSMTGQWVSQPLMGVEKVEAGWKEIGRKAGAGWLHDEKEEERLAEVAVRRAIGKGPPKKGEWGANQSHQRALGTWCARAMPCFHDIRALTDILPKVMC